MNITKSRLLAGLLVGLLPCLASAQITLTYQGHNPGSLVSLNVKHDSDSDTEPGANTKTGLIAPAQKYDITSGSTTLTGVFLFCIELDQTALHPVGTPSSSYSSVSLKDAIEGFNTFAPASQSSARVTNIQKLYAQFADQAAYAAFASDTTPAGGVKIQAFQIALWNLVFEGDFSASAGTPGDYGFFAVTSPSVVANNVVDEANKMLEAVKNGTFSSLPGIAGLVSGTYQNLALPIYGNGSYQDVPEPSTYALLFGVATFGVVTIRRRMKKSAA